MFNLKESKTEQEQQSEDMMSHVKRSLCKAFTFFTFAYSLFLDLFFDSLSLPMVNL